jgi:hypothetical protein
VLVLLGLALAAFLLSLGPEVRLAGHSLGPGLYLWLHGWLLPLRAIRAATRLGVLVLLAVALMAGFGVAWLQTRLPRRLFAAAVAVLVLALGLEYATFPLAYARVVPGPRPVDRVLATLPREAVVLEWPTSVPQSDGEAMVRSLGHGHPVVNGYAGFVPALMGDLSDLLTRPGPPFPVPEAGAFLTRIHPLRYLVVRLADRAMTPEWRAAWRAVRQAPPPWLAFRGSHGDDDLYELVRGPDRGAALERWVSYDFLRRRPVARVTLAPLRVDPSLEQFADVLLNGRAVQRIGLAGPVTAEAVLTAPYHRAAPNVVALRYGYRRPAGARDARYRIGTTGAVAPGDLTVRSGGKAWGDRASIALDDTELAPGRRGYNLVALDPDGGVRGVAAFDTFFEPDAPARLAAWVAALPAGTVVAGAVKDEASGRLDAAAVAALGTLGVAGDLRGRFRESHAFVGVKGAPPGSAAEGLGPRPVEIRIGRPETGLGLELTAFELAAAARP